MPGHSLGKFEDSGQGVQETAIPMFLQHRPDPFDGIVFTVIRSLVQQEGLDLGEAVLDTHPEINQAANNKITGQTRWGEIEVQFVVLG